MSYSEEDAKTHKKIMRRLKKMSSKEIFQTSVNAGIHNPNGTLTEFYGGIKTKENRMVYVVFFYDDLMGVFETKKLAEEHISNLKKDERFSAGDEQYRIKSRKVRLSSRL